MNRCQLALDVFAYADFRTYLADWLAEARRHDPRVSHRWFAKRLGTTDPSALSHVISGRRPLGDERVGVFCRALGLHGDAEGYFRALVALDRARNPEMAELARARLAELRARRAGSPIADDALVVGAVPESRLAELHRLMADVRRQLDHLAHGAPGERVVRVALAMVPVAEDR